MTDRTPSDPLHRFVAALDEASLRWIARGLALAQRWFRVEPAALRDADEAAPNPLQRGRWDDRPNRARG
jgi:hypothetical protein